ncbi:MAG TPA: hypothetical protein VER11_21780 [Polyangiaceae bacterium]|nr:hypothetical protein [Polyangiaceae bacterium]
MRVRSGSGLALLTLTVAVPALADAPPPAVWYRASDSCPNGAQFLDKLAENSRSARLAQGGDRIDFVVTLIADGKETVGRLERQTDNGIVAIRELRDATCEQVADALALSLGLALAPGSASKEPASTKPADVPEASTETSDDSPIENQPPPPPRSAATTSLPRVREATAPAETEPSPSEAQPGPTSQWSLGADLSALVGITTRPLPRGELFLDFQPELGHFSVRGGVVGFSGSSETAIGPVQRWMLGGRVDACPIAWIAGRFNFRPCAGLELGFDNASAQGDGGLDDDAVWAALAGQARLAVALEPQVLWLETSGGALIPLIRKEIFSGSQSLYRDAPVAFHLGFGLSLGLP